MIFDLHNEGLVFALTHGVDFFAAGAGRQSFAEQLVRGRARGLFAAIGTSPLFQGEAAFTRALEEIEQMKAALTAPRSRNPFAFHTSLAAVVAHRDDGSIPVALALEGGFPLNSNPYNVGRLAAAGVTRMTLTHFTSPGWAGSERDGESNGLLPLGEDVVRAMNDSAMIVDVAHGSTQTIVDACRVSRHPVIYSHGGLRAIAKTPRAIHARAMHAIAATGGIIGISVFPDHLRPRLPHDDSATQRFWQEARAIETGGGDAGSRFRALHHHTLTKFPIPTHLPPLALMVDHVLQAVSVVGEDHVAIGTDFDGVPFACAGIDDFTKTPALLRCLAERGLGAETIAKIAHGNVMRVITAVAGKPISP